MMRVIDCIKGTDSHWRHDGDNVFVFQKKMTEVEKMAEIVRLQMEIEKLKTPIDIAA
jgi:hypothetical protein